MFIVILNFKRITLVMFEGEKKTKRRQTNEGEMGQSVAVSLVYTVVRLMASNFKGNTFEINAGLCELLECSVVRSLLKYFLQPICAGGSTQQAVISLPYSISFSILRSFGLFLGDLSTSMSMRSFIFSIAGQSFEKIYLHPLF